MKIAILGGGIVGLASAHALLDRGHAVTIVDPAGTPGRACDGNAGWIAHNDILPLAAPKMWRNLPRWLADPLGPLAIRPAYLPRLAPWLVRFLAAARPAEVERSLEAIRAIHAVALPAWRRRLEALSLGHHLRERSSLSVFRSNAALKAALPVFERQRGFGISLETLSRDDLSALEPALGPAAAAAVRYPDGCHVSDPARLVADLARIARERGATALDARASALAVEGERLRVVLDGSEPVPADAAVVAAGAWSKRLAASVGDRVPLDTERGYNATFAPGTLGLTRPVCFEGEGFVTTPLDTGDRIGGAVEFAGLDAPPNHARSAAMVERLRRFLPGLPATLPEPRRWMGFRPSLPDSLPVIGPSRRTGRVVLAFGHGHYGLTEAAATAEIVTALLLGERPMIDPSPYRAQRFGS
jgi:D-amino-acid dehydrogenase